MFPSEDLDLWAAYKQIWILTSRLILIWALCFFTYFWALEFPQFTYPILYAVPDKIWMNSHGLLLPFIIFNVESSILFMSISIQVSFVTYPLALITINPTLELLLRAVIYGLPLPISVIAIYNGLLFRLSKDTSSGTRFSVLPWKLPNSTRYKNYGEAKARIKHLIRKGTATEKTAIYTMGVCSIGYIYMVLIDFFVWAYQHIALSDPLIIILFGIAILAGGQRFVWNNIQ